MLFGAGRAAVVGVVLWCYSVLSMRASAALASCGMRVGLDCDLALSVGLRGAGYTSGVRRQCDVMPADHFSRAVYRHVYRLRPLRVVSDADRLLGIGSALQRGD